MATQNQMKMTQKQSWMHWFDEDSSYLDEAAAAPAIPEGVPTDTKNKDGVLVDEFGLPQIPASQTCTIQVYHVK